VLDEPTNDLDAETLELLEELLIDYAGTLILISHDRSFLNSVVTRSIVFENGSIGEYAGGYDDWLIQRPDPAADKSAENKGAAKPVASKEEPKVAAKAKKLSYKEQRELEQLPQLIEQLETQMTELQALMGTPEFYQQDAVKISAKQDELAQLEKQLEVTFARWAALENA
jgi:ATP-binding cassette subfamily F protein uup